MDFSLDTVKEKLITPRGIKVKLPGGSHGMVNTSHSWINWHNR